MSGSSGSIIESMSTTLTTPVSPETLAKYEVVIGLEVHVQLATRTKIFCCCPTSFGAPPTRTSARLPRHAWSAAGAQPRSGRDGDPGRAGAELPGSRFSRFARKNYFYPDLPKGYQISQYDQPIAEHGYVDIEVNGEAKRIGITRVHMEDDAGKSVHDGFGIPTAIPTST